MPTLKNKDKKQKSTVSNARRPSYEDTHHQPPAPSFDNQDDYMRPVYDDTESRGKQTYRKPPTPPQPGLYIYILVKLVLAKCACLCLLL